MIYKRKQDGSTSSTVTENRSDSTKIVKQIVSTKSQSDTSSNPQTVTKDVPASFISRDARGVGSNTRATRMKLNTMELNECLWRMEQLNN